MVRVPGVAVVLVALVGGFQRSAIPSGDLVELDVVALDKDDRPVFGLQSADFQVREDGHPVDLKTFSAPSHDQNEEPEPRQLVLLLDDSSVPTTGTKVIQAMAKGILSRGTVRDEVTVVRLNNDRDEPYGDLETPCLASTVTAEAPCRTATAGRRTVCSVLSRPFPVSSARVGAS